MGRQPGHTENRIRTVRPLGRIETHARFGVEELGDRDLADQLVFQRFVGLLLYLVLPGCEQPDFKVVGAIEGIRIPDAQLLVIVAVAVLKFLELNAPGCERLFSSGRVGDHFLSCHRR